MMGQPRSRVDGPAKVTGRARYTADVPVEGLSYGVLVGSTIPSGRIVAIDAAAAQAAPGAVRIFTHENTPRLGKAAVPPAGQTYLPLQDATIHYEGQHVALVVAETLEQAQHAASLVSVRVATEPAEVNFRNKLAEAIAVRGYFENDTRNGDVDAALAKAAVKIDATYRTADRHHNTMEPSATLAVWEDGKLTVYDATQSVWFVRAVLAQALGMRPEDIRVHSHYVGGAFGCKGYVWPHQILCAMAARELRRPVKLVLSRAQTFTSHGYQPASEQKVTLGAARDGKLVAVRHQSITPTSLFDDYVEFAAGSARALYACPAIETRHRVVRVNRGTPTPMRAPHDGLAMVGLEIAMDELAYAVGIDPVALRLENYAEVNPTRKVPFSSKKLRECYREGAERFGWGRRSAAPGSMRDGPDLVGWGMATALQETYRMASSARVTIDQKGEVLVEAGCQEIGNGVYTIMPQIAGEALGVPPDRIALVLGDTALPETGMTAGSATTMGVGSAVHDAATQLRKQLERLGAKGESFGETLRRRGLDKLSADGKWSPPDGPFDAGGTASLAMFSFGAVFVEVRVDEDLRLPRVARVVGVYSAGRIINPRTATSQITGGMIWGIGQALLEASEQDETLGRYLSKNLAGYLVPVNADVPALEAHFVDEVDRHASPIGARGIGELAGTGIGAAIANAVYHATGKRIRELPIRPEML